MKNLFIALMTFAATSAFASENLVCALKQTANPAKYVSAKVDLAKIPMDAVQSDSGLDVGKRNYSFDMTVSREKDKVELSVTFYENNEAQDEVSSSTWNIDLKKSKAGVPVLTEPMENDSGKKVMDFVCYYNE